MIVADKVSFYKCHSNCFTMKLCRFVCSQLPDRWRFVVHSGVDGFCQLVVYLTVAGSNGASMVLQAYTAAVEQYGLPSRARSGKVVNMQMWQNSPSGAEVPTGIYTSQADVSTINCKLMFCNYACTTNIPLECTFIANVLPPPPK